LVIVVFNCACFNCPDMRLLALPSRPCVTMLRGAAVCSCGLYNLTDWIFLLEYAYGLEMPCRRIPTGYISY
jgi:hypothetical protein